MLVGAVGPLCGGAVSPTAGRGRSQVPRLPRGRPCCWASSCSLGLGAFSRTVLWLFQDLAIPGPACFLSAAVHLPPSIVTEPKDWSSSSQPFPWFSGRVLLPPALLQPHGAFAPGSREPWSPALALQPEMWLKFPQPRSVRRPLNHVMFLLQLLRLNS